MTLENGANVNSKDSFNGTALMEAVIPGPGGPRHTEVVRLLVEAGADPNIPDEAGVPPLAHAEQLGYTEMAEILRRAGAHS